MMTRLRWTGALVLLLIAACSGPETSERGDASPPATRRIVAIGDLHGDLEATERALRLAGALDDAGHWAGGGLVLVQTGDILDRGDDEQAILDLFVRLAAEAREAGGAVHRLHGNHELMNVALDFRYVTPAGFADFEDAVHVDPADTSLSGLEPEQRARAAAFRPGGPYARILADAHLTLILGGTLFVHGGVLPEHVAAGLEHTDARVRAWLLGDGPQPEHILRGGSEVWARRFSDEVDRGDCATLDSVLTSLGVNRIVMGHSAHTSGITAYCEDRAWCIDVGMAAAYGGPVEVLEICGDSVRILREPPTDHSRRERRRLNGGAP